jgi:CheY-like chemotaxis protein
VPSPFSQLRVYTMRPGEARLCPNCGAPPSFVAYYGNLSRFLMRCDCGELFVCLETGTAADDAVPPRPAPRAAVVEPHADTRELYCAVLLHDGLDVMSFATAAEALQEMAVWRPALISTEVRFTDCDGLEFCRQLRSSLETAEARIAIVTSETRSDRLAAARQVADVVLIKPCPVDEYLRHVTRLAREAVRRRRFGG